MDPYRAVARTMRAVIYSAPRVFAVEDISPTEPGPRDVLIRVHQTGLCGTDKHLHEGEFLAAFPLVPGHEIVGRVESTGEEVSDLAPGQLVTVNPNSSCGRCDECRRGRQLLCRDLAGIGSNRHGGFAEFVTVPAEAVFDVDGMDPDVAVFAEPTACALHGLETLQPRPGSSALVLGAGASGLLLAQLLATGGVAHVTVAAPSRGRLDRADALGVDSTVQIDRASPEASARMLYEHSGGGYDYVVEATGSARVGAQCVGLTKAGGTVMIYGVTHPGDTFPVHPYDLFRREITIKGSFAEIASFPAAIAALRSGRVRTDGLITHRYGLDDYGRALDDFSNDRSLHKAVVLPDPRRQSV
jgi:D-arabinitol dehydrogenase (NADP+)